MGEGPADRRGKGFSLNTNHIRDRLPSRKSSLRVGSPLSVLRRLGDLRDRGFLRSLDGTEEATFVYSPRTPELADAVTELASAYAVRPHVIIRLIFSGARAPSVLGVRPRTAPRFQLESGSVVARTGDRLPSADCSALDVPDWEGHVHLRLTNPTLAPSGRSSAS
jgi:hypothetical protein